MRRRTIEIRGNNSADAPNKMQSFGGRQTSIREAQTNEGSNPFSRSKESPAPAGLFRARAAAMQLPRLLDFRPRCPLLPN